MGFPLKFISVIKKLFLVLFLSCSIVHCKSTLHKKELDKINIIYDPNKKF